MEAPACWPQCRGRRACTRRYLARALPIGLYACNGRASTIRVEPSVTVVVRTEGRSLQCAGVIETSTLISGAMPTARGPAGKAASTCRGMHRKNRCRRPPANPPLPGGGSIAMRFRSTIFQTQAHQPPRARGGRNSASALLSPVAPRQTSSHEYSCTSLRCRRGRPREFRCAPEDARGRPASRSRSVASGARRNRRRRTRARGRFRTYKEPRLLIAVIVEVAARRPFASTRVVVGRRGAGDLSTASSKPVGRVVQTIAGR